MKERERADREEREEKGREGESALIKREGEKEGEREREG